MGEDVERSGGKTRKAGGMKTGAIRKDTYAITCYVSPVTGWMVSYDRVDPNRLGYWVCASQWLVPGTFEVDIRK